MADSIVEVWNLALQNIGSTSQVATTTDITKAATVCAQWYNLARRSVLRRFPWPSATTTVTLAQIMVAGVAYQPPDYAYAYGIPSDCLKVLELLSPAGRNPTTDMRIPWILRSLPPAISGGAGYTTMLLTDLQVQSGQNGLTYDGFATDGDFNQGLNPATTLPCARYIQDITDCTQWDPLVDLAISSMLSYLIAMPMTMNLQIKGEMAKLASGDIGMAWAAACNEQQADRRAADPTQQARS